MNTKSNNIDVIKLPRLYVDKEFSSGDVLLEAEQAHYLRNVMRKSDGDHIRLFNGKDGEFVAVLTALGKKNATASLEQLLKPQPAQGNEIHLYFAPPKKQRLGWLVEKAVELGTTHLHPVITQNTEMRNLNIERMQKQVIEAAEQCERLDIPHISTSLDLSKLLATPPDITLLACLEREPDAPMISACVKPDTDYAILLGPEGGLTQEETDSIKTLKNTQAVSLGSRILRCETACCVALTSLLFCRNQI